MMTGSPLPIPITTLSNDPRGLAGLRLSAQARQWVAVTTADGSPGYLVPSATDRGKMYTVTSERCTCADFDKRQRPCKHIYAVCLHRAILAAFDS